MAVIDEINKLSLGEDQINQIKDYIRNSQNSLEDLTIAINNLNVISNKKFFLQYIRVNILYDISKEELISILDDTYQFDTEYDRYRFYNMVTSRIIAYSDSDLTKIAIDKLQSIEKI